MSADSVSMMTSFTRCDSCSFHDSYFNSLHSQFIVEFKRIIEFFDDILLLHLLWKVGQKYELLSCDKHKSLAKKLKRDIALCRPDIVHQVDYLFSLFIFLVICKLLFHNLFCNEILLLSSNWLHLFIAAF